MNTFRKLLVLGAGSALLVASGSSFAASLSSAGANFQIVLSQAPCTAITLDGQTFPPQAAGTAVALANQAANNVTITCPVGTTYAWGLNGGANFAVGTRNMLFGANQIAYTLEIAGNIAVGDVGLNALDAGYTETATGISAVTGVAGTGAAVATPLFSDITIVGTEPAGTYVDTVIATVAW